jgi:hypothetical protein
MNDTKFMVVLQEKCSEMVAELNHCANVAIFDLWYSRRLTSLQQQIKQANEVVLQAAELSVKYRKNVLYNLEASGLVKENK